MSEISVAVCEDAREIGNLADDWQGLIQDSIAAVFTSPYWYLAALDAFPVQQLALITARAAGRLVGVLLLARIRTDARGLYFSRVTPPAAGDYQPLVADPEVAETAVPMILDAALDHFGRHGVYWLPNIPSDHPSLRHVRAFLTNRQMPFVEEKEIGFRLRIDGADFATIQKQWPAGHRKDVRRQQKRLSEQGSLSIWEPETFSQAEPVLEEFFRVHDQKWLSQGFPGMFQNSANRRHFHALLKRLWRRGLHFSTLRCGSVDVSFHFGFFSGGWLQWYRPSYRHEFGGYSPGKIHVSMLVERACELKWRGFDFLLGAEPYKALWCNEKVEVTSIHAGFHSWTPSFFWFSRGKPFVRSRFQLAYFRARAWRQRVFQRGPEPKRDQ